MRVYPEYNGRMVDWPRVSALPGAAETLAQLQSKYRLVVATNARDSDETDIWEALKRAGLAHFLERVYCFRSVGVSKPERAFYDFILNDLGAQAQQTLMVGDDWETDILGANRAELWAIWLNESSDETRNGPLIGTIHHLSELPWVIKNLAEGK